MSRDDAQPALPLPRLIACPNCDALYRDVAVSEGERLACLRCRSTLAAPKSGAFALVGAFSATAIVLMVGAVFLPFLTVAQMGLANGTSIIEAALAFRGGLAPLSLGLLAVIVVLPLLRFSGLVYVLAPLALGRRPLPAAARIYRLTEDLRPWSMAEVFTIGTVVAIVKLAGTVALTLGSGFWLFIAMIITVAAADTQLDRWQVWRAIERDGRA